jgi:hypothetical protein
LELYPTYQFLPNWPKNFLQKYGPPFYSHFLYLINFWLDLGKRIYNVFKGRQAWRAENGIVFAELAILAMIAPSVQVDNGIIALFLLIISVLANLTLMRIQNQEGFWSWVLIHTVASFTFQTQGANTAHHHPDM